MPCLEQMPLPHSRHAPDRLAMWRACKILRLCLVAALLLGPPPISAMGIGAGAVAPLPASEIVLQEIRPGVWVHTSYYTDPDGNRLPSNGLIVREGKDLLLVDTAWGERLTGDLLARIEAVIGLPVRRAIVTHAHYDRAAGVDVLESRGILVLAHPMTQRLTQEQGAPVPDKPLAGLERPETAVRVDSVEVFYPGPGHAPDNLMVWVPGPRVLFGGCAVRAALSPSLGNLAHADTGSWPLAIRRAQARYPQVEVVVPGHGAVGGRELLSHTLSLLEKSTGSPGAWSTATADRLRR